MTNKIPIIGPWLAGRPELEKVIANTGWLFIDNIIRMGMGLFVGVWIARYLGPQQVGLLNFSIAFAALFGAFATLGLDNIVVRELVKHPEQRDVFLGSAFALKLIGGFLTLLITLIAIALIRPDETLTLGLVGLSAAGFVFQSLNVIRFYFQAHVQSKYTVYAANSAFLLITLLKVVLLIRQAPLIAFACAGLAEVILTSLFLIVAYRYNHLKIRAWRFERAVAWEQLKDSWQLIFSSLAFMIYMRIDQVMLGQMLGDHAVGIFSAAVRLTEAWYFIPAAIVASVYPAIILTKAANETLYYQRLQKLFDLMAFLGISIAVVTTFSSSYIINYLYGLSYAASADVLALHIWAGAFFGLWVASGSWFIAENLQKYAFYRNFVGGVVNVLLNLYMIPQYGPAGAAVSTIISAGCASVLFNAFNSRTRKIFICQIKALLLYNFIKSGISRFTTQPGPAKG
ncbi:MAG: flippase [Syntrophales bacterium]